MCINSQCPVSLLPQHWHICFHSHGHRKVTASSFSSISVHYSEEGKEEGRGSGKAKLSQGIPEQECVLYVTGHIYVRVAISREGSLLECFN